MIYMPQNRHHRGEERSFASPAANRCQECWILVSLVLASGKVARVLHCIRHVTKRIKINLLIDTG